MATWRFHDADVNDLDLTGRRAVVTRKGGATDVIHWATGTARLLSKLVDGRANGPVFVAKGPPAASRAPALSDLDPATGRAAVQPPRRRGLHRGRPRGDPAPATSQRPHAPRRGQRPLRAADGQEQARLLADSPALPAARRRGRGQADRGSRPGPAWRWLTAWQLAEDLGDGLGIAAMSSTGRR